MGLIDGIKNQFSPRQNWNTVKGGYNAWMNSPDTLDHFLHPPKKIKTVRPVRESGSPNKSTKKAPRVVATAPGSRVHLSPTTTKNPLVTRPPTRGDIAKRTVPTAPKKNPPGKNAPGKTAPGKNPYPTVGIGFDPKKMAQTLTNQGYDADLASIQNQIDMNRGNMASALKDITGWANQIEGQRATGAADAAQAWQGALQQNQVSDANIAGLFGGQAGGESAAYSGAGQDMLGALSASDKSFDARMAPILAAQGMDYQRRASAGFNQDLKGLQVDQRSLQKEKGQAYSKNLMDMMNMAWGRKQDVINNQIAQEGLRQSNELHQFDLQKGQQDIIQGSQAIKQNAQQIKATNLAIKKATIELKAQVNSPNGIDWNSPDTRGKIGGSALSGSLNQNTGGFMQNPKLALKAAMQALRNMGLDTDSRAVDAVMTTFRQMMINSHGHRQWMGFSVSPKGQILYDPTKARKKYK